MFMKYESPSQHQSKHRLPPMFHISQKKQNKKKALEGCNCGFLEGKFDGNSPCPPLFCSVSAVSLEDLRPLRVSTTSRHVVCYDRQLETGAPALQERLGNDLDVFGYGGVITEPRL